LVGNKILFSESEAGAPTTGHCRFKKYKSAQLMRRCKATPILRMRKHWSKSSAFTLPNTEQANIKSNAIET